MISQRHLEGEGKVGDGSSLTIGSVGIFYTAADVGGCDLHVGRTIGREVITVSVKYPCVGVFTTCSEYINK